MSNTGRLGLGHAHSRRPLLLDTLLRHGEMEESTQLPGRLQQHTRAYRRPLLHRLRLRQHAPLDDLHRTRRELVRLKTHHLRHVRGNRLRARLHRHLLR